MITIKRILCPTDLSTESDEALRYAVALARMYQAELFLLHCSERETNEPEQSNAQVESLFTESLVPHLGLAAMNELNWVGYVRSNVNNMGRAIVQEANALKVDLIVMRSRRRPHAAVLLGSTAEEVCRCAHCPVLVTHPRDREWVSLSTGEIDLNRVLIAHDFSEASKVALGLGASIAQEYQAEVHLLHVLATQGNAEPELAWSASAGGSAYAFTARKLQDAMPPDLPLWCRFVNIVRYGKAYEEILKYAKENEIDLICMGVSHNEWVLDKLLGSNVDRVLRHSPCPILVAGYRDRGTSQN
jgi:nucleotide-binding universal stress UspA family protein